MDEDEEGFYSPSHRHMKGSGTNPCVFVLMAIFVITVFFLLRELRKGHSPTLPPDVHVLDDTINAESLHMVRQTLEMLKWGQGGAGVKVKDNDLHPYHQQEKEEGFVEFGFNRYLSDRISMRRVLPDVRDPMCGGGSNNSSSDNTTKRPSASSSSPLLKASVIIVCRDEPWTTLLRTVYSVIDRSSPELLEELILVDDASSVAVLQYPRLEHYLAVLKKVRIVRLPHHHGPARARMRGLEEMSGDVAVFLNPRCECTDGWLEPLLARITEDRRTIAVPVVDTINYETFEYISQPLNMTTVGTFRWDLTPTRRYLATQPESPDEMPNVPVLTEGIFAVSKALLLRLGNFDDRLASENMVNLELSFRAWMCGAKIKLVLCSHVGYVFAGAPAASLESAGDDVLQDSQLVADLWMSGFQEFVYERLASKPTFKKYDFESPPLAVGSDLQCMDFSWFLKAVEPSAIVKGNIIKRGQLIHIVKNETVLVLIAEDNTVRLEDWYIRPHTFWYLTDMGELKTEGNMCLSVSLQQTQLRQPQKLHQQQQKRHLRQQVQQQKQLQIQQKQQLPPPQQQQQKQQQQHYLEASVPNTTRFVFHDLVRNVPDGSKDTEDPEDDKNGVLEEEGKDFMNMDNYLSDFQEYMDENEDSRIARHSLRNLQELVEETIPKENSIAERDSYLPHKKTKGLPLSEDLMSSDRLKTKSARKHKDNSLLFEREVKKETYRSDEDVSSVYDLTLKACGETNSFGQAWIEDGTLMHLRTKTCMEAQKISSDSFVIKMVSCDSRRDEQSWHFFSR